jgi:hypothetical protein
MLYDYNKILNKIKKYKTKYNSTTNAEKKIYYMEKLIYYNRYQNGGYDISESIKIDVNIEQSIKEISDLINKTSLIDDTTITNLTTGINTIKDNYNNMKQQLVNSTTEFAKYNTKTKKSLIIIQELTNRLKLLDESTLQLIIKIINDMSKIDFNGMEWNQKLIKELGILMSEYKETNINNTLDRIDTLFNKQGNNQIHNDVKNFFNKIVKLRIDKISKNEKHNIRLDSLSKKFFKN